MTPYEMLADWEEYTIEAAGRVLPITNMDYDSETQCFMLVYELPDEAEPLNIGGHPARSLALMYSDELLDEWRSSGKMLLS